MARRTRVYAENVCLKCGATIHESAYSGRRGNLRKHTAACEGKPAFDDWIKNVARDTEQKRRAREENGSE